MPAPLIQALKIDDNPRRRWLFVHVLLIHLLFIGGPLCYMMILDKVKPPKENIYRVKLGPRELSAGPVVGPPERVPSPPQPVPAPPQVVPAPPKPKPQPKPKPEKPKPKPKPQPKPKPNKPKPKPKPNKPKPKPDPNAGVYTPPAASGGSISNPNVPIGGRNAAQTHADKFDNRTPGGGAKADMEKYGKNLTRFLKSKWTAPPDSLLASKRPKVLIELDIAPDGRVLSKKIVTRSGIKSMDDSIDRMLQGLDRVPKPPKRTTLEIYLQMED